VAPETINASRAITAVASCRRRKAQAQLRRAFSLGSYAVGNSGASKTIDRANGDFQTITMTGNCTFTFTAGIVKGEQLTLELTQDGTGSPTSNFKKAGGSLTLSTGAGAVDQIRARWDGTNWVEVSRAGREIGRR
jgi:hypothetical protein